MPKIIISYRRADTLDIAMRIRDGLKRRFGTESVFTDIDNIPAGIDFAQYINDEIASADALLAVVGPRWLRTKREDKSNLPNEPDYVQLEIEAALNQKIKVTPVLVGGAKMPKAKEMPESIQAFAKLNAAEVGSGVNFENDLDRLVISLEKHFALLPLAAGKAGSTADDSEGGDKSTRFGPRQATTPGPSPARPLIGTTEPFKEAHRRVPALGVGIGAAIVAVMAALVLGFFGHGRASFIIIGSMIVAAALVCVCALFIPHRNPTVARMSIATIWSVSLIYIAFLAVTATAIGFNWPSSWSTALGYEIEDEICSSPLAAQKAYSCDTDGDWVVVGVKLDDSDKVTLNIRQKPDGTGAPLRAIPPNSTKVLVNGCNENWCEVKCESVAGWSKKKFLQPRSEQLFSTQGSVLPGTSGLAIRSGPNQTCHAEGFVQSGRKVIVHGCEPNPTDQTQQWCRITHDATSGWLPDLNLVLSKETPQPNLEPSK